VLSLVPSAEEPNKVLATAKVVGLSALLVGVGAAMYYAAKRKQQKRQIA
jgi:preprotein translocase subunit YajC